VGGGPPPKTLITPALFSRPPHPPHREKRENNQTAPGGFPVWGSQRRQYPAGFSQRPPGTTSGFRANTKLVSGTLPKLSSQGTLRLTRRFHADGLLPVKRNNNARADWSTLRGVQGISVHAESRIALVRHARSAHVHAGWIDATGFRAWREAYEAAGIVEGERAPAGLEQLAASAGLVLSSDAPRAMASARLLAPGREIVVSPLLRELDLEGPDLGGLSLPLAGWALAVGVRTLLLTLHRQHPSAPEAARVDQAASWLEELSVQHSLNVVVTHASFRRQLSRRLAQKGWQAEPGRRSLQPWSPWLFRRPPCLSPSSPGEREMGRSGEEGRGDEGLP
jgi:hypothetical protein